MTKKILKYQATIKLYGSAGHPKGSLLFGQPDWVESFGAADKEEPFIDSWRHHELLLYLVASGVARFRRLELGLPRCL